MIDRLRPLSSPVMARLRATPNERDLTMRRFLLAFIGIGLLLYAFAMLPPSTTNHPRTPLESSMFGSGSI